MAPQLSSPALTIIFISCTFSFFSFSSSIPYILLHGLRDSCSNSVASSYKKLPVSLSRSPGFCIEVGNGAITSWTKPLLEQVDEVCRKVKAKPELRNGYNIVGQSQVINFISMGGPQAGVAPLIKQGMYSPHVQATCTPSGYIKDPNDIHDYLAHCSFLPKLNNELPKKDPTYKKRLTSLKNIVLIMFQEDIVVRPKESAWFEFYPDNYKGPIKPLKETKIYREDWIGLRTLNETGRLKLASVPGGHLMISFADTLRYVAPYLK